MKTIEISPENLFALVQLKYAMNARSYNEVITWLLKHMPNPQV